MTCLTSWRIVRFSQQLDNLQEAWGAGAWTEALAVLRQAVERCNKVVQSFLALARQQPPTRHAVALNAVIGDVLVLLGQALAADGITVQLHLAEDLIPLWADANQLHHVVSNPSPMPTRPCGRRRRPGT